MRCHAARFWPERERPGLEGQPGRRLRRVRELPAPPSVDIVVVADVAEQYLHVQEVVWAVPLAAGSPHDAGPGAVGFFVERSGDELAVPHPARASR